MALKNVCFFLLIICCHSYGQINDDLFVLRSVSENQTINFQQCIDNWNESWVQERINSGIKLNRMGIAAIKIVDKKGDPLVGASVSINQKNHHFLFGSKFPYLGAFDNPDKNKRYIDLYTSLFNFSTIPLYWRAAEVARGQYSFVNAPVKSPYYNYLVSIDSMVQFCSTRNIKMRGHTLVWERSQPHWTPQNKDSLKSLYRNLFDEIAHRYSKKIQYWDVVNEPLNRPIEKILPDDCTNWSMNLADKYFLPDNVLCVNATTRNSWINFYWEDSPYYLLVKNLQLRGTRIDAIGMQFHLWYGQQFINDVYNGVEMTPTHLYRVLDQYAKLNLPIHITEITLPTLDVQQGEQWQKFVGANMLKLFFSHPSVDIATWWNLADELARDGKKFNGGLVAEGLRAKPIYTEIKRLFNEEWHTGTTKQSDSEGKISAHGFYGEYDIVVTAKNKSQTYHYHLSKVGNNDFILVFEQ